MPDALKLSPHHVTITELPDYLRGRESGEISELIRHECLHLGLDEQQLSFTADPLAGSHRALELLQPGDLILLLVFSHRDEVIELLEARVKG